MRKNKLFFWFLFGILFVVFVFFTWYLVGLPKDVKITLYGTSTNSKTIEIENSLNVLREKFGGKIKVEYHLVAEKNVKGEFLSFNQSAENQNLAALDIAENKIQLVIKKLSPEKYEDYLKLRNQNIGDADSEKYFRGAGLDAKKIKKAIEDKQGDELLNQEIEAFKRLKEEKKIEAIPALFINGNLYEGGTDLMSLAAAFVKPLLRGKNEALKESQKIALFDNALTIRAPWSKKSVAGFYECYGNNDCDDKSAKDGFCKEADTEDAFCRYEEPAPVGLVALSDEKCISCHTDKAISLLKQDFKKLSVKNVDLDSDEGRELIKNYNLKALPAFIFEENVEKALPFSQYITGRLMARASDKDKRYILTQTEVRKFLDRNFEKNKLNLFVNAYNPLSLALEKKLIERKRQFEKEGKESFELVINHVLLASKNDRGEPVMKIETPAGVPEIEESVRQVVIAKYYPDNFFDYLLQRNLDLNKDFNETFKNLGINEKQVALATKNEGEVLIKDNGRLAFDLQINNLPVFLWENQAVVLSLEDLRRIEQFKDLNLE